MVRNQVDGQVTEIDVVFDYRSPWQIAFDEIIEHLELDTEELGGAPFGTSLIHPNYINLNPNRASLSYRVSLYYPQTLEGFVARVKVYGNYE